MKTTVLKMLGVDELVTLKRNPQYLTPVQMESLKESIRRDGFCAPILVRRTGGDRYEIVSGNHRYMAAVEMKLKRIPCVIARLSDREARRLAINLNTIHGNPNVEILAPFLGECDIDLLRQIHIDEDMKQDLMRFDATLADALARLQAPEKMNHASPTHANKTCKCPNCGTTHIQKSL